MVGRGLIDAAAAAGGIAGLLQLRPLSGETHLGKAQEDQSEDGAGVLLGLEAGIGAELVGGVPQASFKRRGAGVFFSRGDPLHQNDFF